MDLSQQGGLPAGHRLLLRAPECGRCQINRKTLVYPHHSIQELQVKLCLSVCLSTCLSVCLSVDFFIKVVSSFLFSPPWHHLISPWPLLLFYSLSIDSSKDLSVWLDSLSSTIRSALSCSQVALRLWENPDNNVCGDCGSANPEWASVNLLLVICQACAGTSQQVTQLVVM